MFEGQPLSGGDFEFSITPSGALLNEDGFGNHLRLEEEQVFENVEAIQKRNEIKNPSLELRGMNFSVEMETGTGKTYVYLRTYNPDWAVVRKGEKKIYFVAETKGKGQSLRLK